jgi:glycosyltransferase involved in cell wall biosynthesis
MKVAMIETGGWGGIGHYTWNLCEALAAEGVDVHLLTNSTFELASLPRRFQVDPCFAAGRRYLTSARLFLNTLNRLNPQVIHVQSLLSSRFDAFLWPAARRRAPLVMTAHNIRSHESSPWEAWTTWRSFRAADALVVHTNESVRIATQRLGSRPVVALIHHGDYGFFAPAQPPSQSDARNRLHLPPSVPLLLAFGAIRPYKGILELFQTLTLVRERHPGAHLIIAGPLLVGSGVEYRDAIERAGLGDAVTFRPQYVPHAEVALHFAAADVAVYNYSEVTDSGALRIACSLGTPIVATAVGAFREFLQDGVTGRLVPPHNPAVLTAAICDLLDDREAALRMAKAALDLSVSRWSWRDSARQTIALYEALVTRETP